MRLKTLLLGTGAALVLSAGVASAATVTTGLNLRSGPGTGYNVIATMPAAAHVAVLSCRRGWCHVDWRGEEGYASRSYISGVGYASNGCYYYSGSYYDYECYPGYASEYYGYPYEYDYGPGFVFGFGGEHHDHHRHFRGRYHHFGHFAHIGKRGHFDHFAHNGGPGPIKMHHNTVGFNAPHGVGHPSFAQAPISAPGGGFPHGTVGMGPGPSVHVGTVGMGRPSFAQAPISAPSGGFPHGGMGSGPAMHIGAVGMGHGGGAIGGPHH